MGCMFLHHSSVIVFNLLLASKYQNMLANYETCFTSVCSPFLRHCQFISMSNVMEIQSAQTTS